MEGRIRHVRLVSEAEGRPSAAAFSSPLRGTGTAAHGFRVDEQCFDPVLAKGAALYISKARHDQKVLHRVVIVGEHVTVARKIRLTAIMA